MNRYVFLSLVVLGWGFWELSGGGDFEPSYRRDVLALPDPASTTTAIPLSASVAGGSPSTRTPLAEPIIASSALAAIEAQVPTVRALPTENEPPRQIPTTELTVHQTGPSLASEATLSLGLSGFAASSPLIPTLSSTAGTAAAIPAPPNTARPASETTPVPVAVLKPNLRTVQGSRVNLRGGPGTSHAVITTLQQGQTVEILRDEGAGWVKLRDQDSGRVGWMARKMLSPSDWN